MHRIFWKLKELERGLENCKCSQLLDLIDSKLSKIFEQKDDSKGLNFPNVKLSIDNLTFDDLASFYSSTGLLVFRDFVSELKVTGKSQKVKLMHFVHTHYPSSFLMSIATF